MSNLSSNRNIELSYVGGLLPVADAWLQSIHLLSCDLVTVVLAVRLIAALLLVDQRLCPYFGTVKVQNE